MDHISTAELVYGELMALTPARVRLTWKNGYKTTGELRAPNGLLHMNGRGLGDLGQLVKVEQMKGRRYAIALEYIR